MDRLTVGNVFCGWDTIKKMHEAAKNPRDAFLLLTLLKTGGRVSEVLNTRWQAQGPGQELPAFDMNASKHSVIVNYMPLGKRKLKDDDGKHIFDVRDSFPVLADEPLSGLWVEYLNKGKDNKGFLFPSYESSRAPPMSRATAWNIITDIGDRVGVRVSNHYFRGMRASQLVEDYDFDDKPLDQFFGWLKPMGRSSRRYTGIRWQTLERWMIEGKARVASYSFGPGDNLQLAKA